MLLWASKGVFIAWRALSRRTKELSERLKIKLLFVPDIPPYVLAVLKTIIFILQNKPKAVFIQLPQGPLLLIVTVFKKVLKYRLIADVHTAFLYHMRLKEKVLNKPFILFLNHCDIVLIHNMEIKKKVIKSDVVKKTFVLHDPLPKLSIRKKTIDRKNNVVKFVFPASFAADEPIEQVIQAFLEIIKENPNCYLYITGKWKRQRYLKKYISTSRNIIFTGFLPREEYESLLVNSDVVIALTIREYTFLSAAAEGLAAEKPLLLSNTRTLRSIFRKGAIFVSPTDINDIKRGLKLMLEDTTRKRLLNEIKELKREYLGMLNKKLHIIQKLIN